MTAAARRGMNPAAVEQMLIDDVTAFTHDPLGYVKYCFPWGVPGTDLANQTGPNEWQTTVLTDIGARLQNGATVHEVIREAIASGHGVGKSALICWLIKWAMDTFEDCRGIVTANTETQLRTKTWPEFAKWHRLALTSHWFTLTATSYFSVDPDHAKNWRFDLVPWSETNTEAFAGLHNQEKRLLVVFDEGSKIPDIVWETTEGALTDANTEIIWIVCGNPTQNTGRFRGCFESLKHRWNPMQVDARSVPFTNKKQIQDWIDDYGEDSDFVRVRVRGVFPRAGAQQLIGVDIVEGAETREVNASIYDPFIMGVDVARFGDDQSVIYFRKGRDGRTHPPMKFRGMDTMALAARVVELADFYKADAVFIDGGGVGGGVVDRCRQLRLAVVEVNFGGKPDGVSVNEEKNRYYNKRAEMWGNMRDWLKTGAIPKDPDFRKQLIQQTYEFRTIRGGDAIILTSKEVMKADGLDSPDIPDGLALTFAHPVLSTKDRGGYPGKKDGNEVRHDYDPLGDATTNDYDPMAAGEITWQANTRKRRSIRCAKQQRSSRRQMARCGSPRRTPATCRRNTRARSSLSSPLWPPKLSSQMSLMQATTKASPCQS